MIIDGYQKCINLNNSESSRDSILICIHTLFQNIHRFLTIYYKKSQHSLKKSFDHKISIRYGHQVSLKIRI